MHNIGRENRTSEGSKYCDQFNIPSSVASRIGPPDTNLIESPSLENFQFSFAETQIEIDIQNFFQIQPSGNFSLSQTLILKELDAMKMQVQMINKKLEYNLSVLKEKQERQKLLKRIFTLKNDERKRDKSMRDEVKCSCSKNCSLF
ncbi:hypothetical protein SteCoe_27595 [Stentor coeruleus]|uniref:Uncharacterized protein n=1 Tax=Stentor coeruleus TaxID=5963 RepID=A0A1R2BA39_9CILI|nr:hypothetical protein SteCoe_27595 [Stentor coeruleus]